MTYGTGTGGTTRRLGKKVQDINEQRHAKNKKDHAREAEEDNKNREMMRSLQIAHDPRYQKIEHYKDAESTRLEGMLSGTSKMPRLYPEPWGFPEPLGSRSMYKCGTCPEEDEAKRLAEQECEGFKNMTFERFKGRIGWEESFKSNVKQLMVDFSLTNNPSCRLNHLDRMHNWFGKEGKKQAKKETASPNYLTFEKHARPLPGSARDVAPPVSSLTLDLAGIMKTPARKRVERQFGVVPGAGGTPGVGLPRGGYK